jgi:hypothetical protein
MVDSDREYACHVQTENDIIDPGHWNLLVTVNRNSTSRGFPGHTEPANEKSARAAAAVRFDVEARTRPIRVKTAFQL